MSVLVLCALCGRNCTNHHWMCDRLEVDWCSGCFPQTQCGKGRHGEGCPTQVFSDGAAVSEPAETSPARAVREFESVAKDWDEYPIGTTAKQSWTGCQWTKTERGWKAGANGSTFPIPGGADQVRLPQSEPAETGVGP